MTDLKRQNYTLEQGRGSHTKVRDASGRLLAQFADHSTDDRRLVIQERALQRAGYVEGHRVRREVINPASIEGQLLFALSDGPHSALVLANNLGVDIGTVETALKTLSARLPNLTKEHTLWVWDGKTPEGITLDKSKTREFVYPLRPDVRVKLYLPEKVSRAEITRLISWMRKIRTEQ